MLRSLNFFRNNYSLGSLKTYERMSSVPLPDFHILNEKCQAKLDILYPLQKRAPPPETEGSQCSLAGDPKVLPAAILQLREDIIEKWDQKPGRDVCKEMVKYSFTY